MNRVWVQEASGRTTVRGKRIKKILKKSLELLQLDQHELHVNLIRDSQMKTLNQTYRGKRKTTDVLSFDQHIQVGSYFFLGDIVISIDQTKKQNQQQAHRLKDEYAILAIHGLLHLLGHDHAQAREEKIMFDLQQDLYRKTRHYA